MEDRFSIKMTTINEQTVSLFGVFDGTVIEFSFIKLFSFPNMSLFLTFHTLGHGGSLAAEYLKEHLFENLVNHPELLRDTKLAISNVLPLAPAVLLPNIQVQCYSTDVIIFLNAFAKYRPNVPEN